ncbi:MAG TPA: nickel pincer cofactor biosynthesis protein LarC [Armatimonadota bacterium]|nr:nickel pincer cofactor biosynthesis protein LarC [Armatimonadota bacterium]
MRKSVRIAYFDCFAGISGDMTLGALLDAGVDEAQFRRELGKIEGIEFDLRVSKVLKKCIQATNVQVLTRNERGHRKLKDVSDIINSSELSETVKARAVDAFRRLAEAEAAVHGSTPEEVMFHEVGAVDAIVDIAGTAVGTELLGIERIVCSPLPMGRGFVETAHGKIPLPAPATVELLKGVPVYSAGIEGELVTPTGAALVRTLASDFGEMPAMTVQAIGCGAGKAEFPFPNVLRILVGEASAEMALPRTDRVSVVETNIDDMNPEFYDLIFDRLFKAGALDVYLTPVYMKKSRPATLLSAVCPIDRTEDIIHVMLAETTTFGVRISSAYRRCLERKWETVTTRFGEVRMKVGIMGGAQITASPEYEDCRKAAEVHGVPVRLVYDEAVARYYNGR